LVRTCYVLLPSYLCSVLHLRRIVKISNHSVCACHYRSLLILQHAMRFTEDFFGNLHLNLNSTGCEIVVTLAVTPAMTLHISPNLVMRKGDRYYCVLRRQLSYISEVIVRDNYEELLNRNMIICRRAKQAVLEDQIKRLKLKTVEL